MTSPQTTSDLQAVADAIRAHDGYVVTTHENPDGDALGSLLGMKLALDALGKESAMYLAGEQPLPIEYRFMTLDGLVRGSAAELAARPVIAVDAANEKRLGDPALLEAAPFAIDIDHHHDNSRFGQANLVVAEASSTAEVLRDVFAALDVALTPAIAEALYIGLVTDTGRFQYKNTTPKALRLGGELLRARRRRPPDLPEHLREHRVPEAEAPRARARAGAAAGERRAHRLVHHARRLRRDRRAGRCVGGDHRLAARGGGDLRWPR